MESKPFYMSKVFWFNVLAVIVIIAQQFGYIGDLDASVQGYVDVFLPALLALINLGLRFVTKQPVALKK